MHTDICTCAHVRPLVENVIEPALRFSHPGRFRCLPPKNLPVRDGRSTHQPNRSVGKSTSRTGEERGGSRRKACAGRPLARHERPTLCRGLTAYPRSLRPRHVMQSSVKNRHDRDAPRRARVPRWCVRSRASLPLTAVHALHVQLLHRGRPQTMA